MTGFCAIYNDQPELALDTSYHPLISRNQLSTTMLTLL
jgi:hypothetical protein